MALPCGKFAISVVPMELLLINNQYQDAKLYTQATIFIWEKKEQNLFLNVN
jgi:hypothetical protein